MAHPSVSTAQTLARAESKPKVGFSFDHLAGNQKVQRTFVSGEMLSIAREQLIKNDRWEFKHVVDRLTSVLTLHTHSRSTTATIRSNYEAVSALKDYELLMQLSANNVEIMVFGIRGKGRKLKELLIFRFRDDYCSRVVQLTGELTTDDIGNIIKLNKKLFACSLIFSSPVLFIYSKSFFVSLNFERKAECESLFSASSIVIF